MILLTGHRENRKGFSLVELLLVCTIGGILLGMVIPQVTKSLSHLEMRDTCRSIASLINYAQATGIVQETHYRLNIDIANSRYWLTYQKDPLSGGSYERLKTSIGRIYHLPQGMTIDSISLEDPNLAGQNFITFYPDGGVDEAVIKLSNEDRDNFSISVTGRIGQVVVREIL